MRHPAIVSCKNSASQFSRCWRDDPRSCVWRRHGAGRALEAICNPVYQSFSRAVRTRAHLLTTVSYPRSQQALDIIYVVFLHPSYPLISYRGKECCDEFLPLVPRKAGWMERRLEGWKTSLYPGPETGYHQYLLVWVAGEVGTSWGICDKVNIATKGWLKMKTVLPDHFS